MRKGGAQIAVMTMVLILSAGGVASAQDKEVGADQVKIRVEALASAAAEEEAAARQSLVEMGPAAVPHLLGPVADKNVEYGVRAAIAWVLGELADKRATKALAKVWAEKNAPGFFRVQVAMALASIGKLRPLRSFVSPTTKDKVLLAKAAIALANHRDKKSIKALVPFAKDEDIGTFVVLALARLGHDPGKDQLKKLLATKMFRAHAAIGLAMLGDNTVIYQLRFCLDDPDPFIRRDAAELLGKAEDLQSADKLEKMSKRDPDRRVKAACAAAAKKIAYKKRRQR